MDGWRIRHGIEGDVPFFALVILSAGALIGAGIAIACDWLVHRHRAV
jgi:hypothetical protein